MLIAQNQNCVQIAAAAENRSTIERIADELQTFSLFDGVPREAVHETATAGRLCRRPRHGLIYQPETQDRFLYFLLRGKVKIVRLAPDGREIILDLLGAGDIFGELSLSGEPEFFEEGYVETAEALTDVEVLMVARSTMFRLLAAFPQLTPRVLDHFGAKLRHAQRKLESLVFKDARQRILQFLLHYAETFGRIRRQRVTVEKFVSQSEIAQATGTSRQTVAAVLNQLRRAGAIDFDSRHLFIHDLDAIRNART